MVVPMLEVELLPGYGVKMMSEADFNVYLRWNKMSLSPLNFSCTSQSERQSCGLLYQYLWSWQ